MKPKTTNQTNVSFGKIMLASAVGVIIAWFVIVTFWLFSALSLAMAGKSKQETKPKSVLVIKLDRPVKEQQQKDFDLNLPGLNNVSPLGLNKILAAIKTAKTDDNIKGIFLDLGITQASLAELQEIRNAIIDFKSSGKFVIAHSSSYTNGSYFLSTAADKIYLTPTGMMLWQGFSGQVMFYKDLLKKIGVKPIVIRHGKFKSAVEPFILDSMSDANRLQMQQLFDNLWSQYVQTVADARNLKPDFLNNVADNLLLNSDEQTVKLGFIDGLKYRSDVIDEMKSLLDIDTDKKLNLVSLSKYIEMHTAPSSIMERTPKNSIAVIYAEGDIIPGRSKNNSMGSATIVKAIDKAMKNKNIKAIVFRVNSPGGSALASEIILHELEKAHKEKPVIVSMGRYAASGGYYISCKADEIFAEPYTITGSIGVFGLFFNIQDLLNNKLGINVDVVKTNKHADLGNLTRPLTADEYNFIQSQIERTYDIFISHVAEGRHLSKTFVDSIGQGRVWSAQDALKLGLIDSIGGINDAIAYAAQKVGLNKYEIVEYPKVKSFIEALLDNYQTSIRIKTLGQAYKLYEKIEDLQNMNGIQARLPFEIENL